MGKENPMTNDSRTTTLEKARRRRAHRHHFSNGKIQFEGEQQPVRRPSRDGRGEPSQSGEQPLPTRLIEHHDVLLVPPKGVLHGDQVFRFPVNKTGNPSGHSLEEAGSPPPKGVSTNEVTRAGIYDSPPEVLDAYDYSQRNVRAIAEQRRTLEDEGAERGPAFATLPVKPEPAATSLGLCYLINTRNLNFRNAWTAEEWNDVPGGPDLEPAPGVDDDGFEVALAAPQGKVLLLRIDGLRALRHHRAARVEIAKGASLSIESVDLGHQIEVWNQLRNGCVAGRVLYRRANGHSDVVPLVNITALSPARKEP
jgi:hypothetical protein